MTDSNLFLDSSAWIAYLLGESKHVRNIVESDSVLFTSTLSLFEINKVLQKKKVKGKPLKRALNFVIAHSVLVVPSTEICIVATEQGFKNKLAAMDALIYTSARTKNATLVTLDQDFTPCKHVFLVS